MRAFFWDSTPKIIYRHTIPQNSIKNNSRASRKCNKIGNRTDGASSIFAAFTLKIPICCVLASGPFPVQPYYSRGENIKFYSTSHVNTFLMMTNDCGEHCYSEKASQTTKKQFFTFFHFFWRVRHLNKKKRQKKLFLFFQFLVFEHRIFFYRHTSFLHRIRIYYMKKLQNELFTR